MVDHERSITAMQSPFLNGITNENGKKVSNLKKIGGPTMIFQKFTK